MVDLAARQFVFFLLPVVVAFQVKNISNNKIDINIFFSKLRQNISMSCACTIIGAKNHNDTDYTPRHTLESLQFVYVCILLATFH